MKRSPLDRHAAQRRYENRLRAEGHHKYRRIGRNRQRSRDRREKAFGEKADFIRSLRCCACGAAPPSDPHHVRTRGAGGTSADLVPCCRDCHRFYHDRGRETFERIFEVDLRAIADELEAQWTS